MDSFVDFFVDVLWISVDFVVDFLWVFCGFIWGLFGVDSGTHSCCTLAIEKYQIYKLISRHRVARYELVGLIFLFLLSIFCRYFVDSFVDFFVDVLWISVDFL